LKVDWNVASAIGQCFGAIATFIAVLVALKQNKPSVKVTAGVKNVIQPNNISSNKPVKIADNRLYITATNTGNIPVNIISMELKMPKRYGKDLFIVPEINTIPKIIMPSEQVSVWTDALDLEKMGVKEFNICCAYDSCGRVYYCKTTLFKRISRFWWWKFSDI